MTWQGRLATTQIAVALVTAVWIGLAMILAPCVIALVGHLCALLSCPPISRRDQRLRPRTISYHSSPA